MTENIFSVKDSITIEGITADHVWYNASLLNQKMSSWGFDFQKLVSVMEARHKEHLKIITALLAERSELKKELLKFNQTAQV